MSPHTYSCQIAATLVLLSGWVLGSCTPAPYGSAPTNFPLTSITSATISATAMGVITQRSTLAPTESSTIPSTAILTNGTETPRPPVKSTATVTFTPVVPGKITAEGVLETNRMPEIECGFDELWIAAPPYDKLQLFLGNARHSYRTPRWSVDGTQIAFVDQSNGGSQINIVDMNSNKTTAVSSKFPYMQLQPGGFCSQLGINSWSHSNRWLAFGYEYFTVFSPHLYYLDASTGEAVTITEKAWRTNLAVWAPVSDRLAFVEGVVTHPGGQTEPSEIRVMEMSGGQPVYSDLPLPAPLQHRDDGAPPDQLIRRLAWLTDDTLLVSSSPSVGSQPGQLFRVSLASKNWELLAVYPRDLSRDKADPSLLAVSKDGQFVAWAGNEILILDTATWHEYARLPVNWLDAILLQWVQD